MVKKDRLLLIGVILVFVVATIWCFWGTPVFEFLVEVWDYWINYEPEDLVYEPLDAAVLQDICPKLERITGKEECLDSEPLYELDLIDTLVEIVRRRGYLSTKEDWDLYFSEYLWFCESPTNPEYGKDYYRCFYDFQDDEERVMLMIYFYVDGSIKEIRLGGGSS